MGHVKGVSIQWLGVLIVALLTSACSTPGGNKNELPTDVALGPLMYSHPLTLEKGRESGILGPFFYERFGREGNETYTQRSIRPFLSWYRKDDNSTETLELVYPLLTYHRTGTEYRVQIGQWIGFSGGLSQTGGNEGRTTFFPFYFARRSGDPERDYTAIFPLGGTVKNRLLKDEINFFMFPLYAKSRVRDRVTWNYLFPIVHFRKGENLRGWQVWPLYGREEKTFGKEGPGEKGGYQRTFFAWPFYHHNEEGIGTVNHSTFNALLPLYAVGHSPQKDETHLLWPFFYKSHFKNSEYTEYGSPWPIIVNGESPKKTHRRLWPIYGKLETDTRKREFYLWPMYVNREVNTERINFRQERWLGALYQHSREERKETGKISERKQVWPLFTHETNSDGHSRFQLLSPLEPLLPGNKGIRRNYSPLFALWHSERNAATGHSSRSFLWHLYRDEHTPDYKKCSLLFGLIDYKKNEEGKEWRLLWLLPFRSKTTNP